MLRPRACPGDRPLHDQKLTLGAGVESWDDPTVTGGRRAVGSVLIVDPEWDHTPGGFKTTDRTSDIALLPLDKSAVLITALATDGLALHHMLNAGIAAVEAPLRGTSA